jgi:VRR-NUC domain
MTESQIQTNIRIAINQGRTRAFRNNIAKLQVRGAWLNYGIPGPGGSDLIGWHSMTIRPEHVGRTVAVFLAVECKSATGKPSPQQTNFLDFVATSGGIAGIARSPADATDLIKKYEQ